MRYDHFTMLPEQAFKPVGKKMTLEGGGSQPSQPSQPTQTSQVTIPEYAKPYMERLLGKAEAASETPYQTYSGERIAGPTAEQQAARQDVAGMGPSQQYNIASGLAGMAGGAALAGMGQNYSPMAAVQTYQSPQFQGMDVGYLSTQAPQLQQYQMRPAQRVGTGSFAQPGAAEAYMSPYMQNVVDIQQREAQRQADIARTERGAGASRSGAFGGSRHAIMEAEAARNLALQKGDIQAQGLQSAYQQAQQAYQTDAARQLQAQLANQQAGLTTGQQNLQALLQTQGLGAQTGLQSQQLNQAAQLQAQQQALAQNELANKYAQQNAQLAAQYGLSGLQAEEQSRQFAANLGLQGLQTGVQGATQAAATLGQLGGAQQQSALDLAKAQESFGSLGQQQQQQTMDLAYQDFLNQQRYPYTQLGFMSDILRGSGNLAGTGGYAMYQQPPSMAQQIVGPGLLGLGLYNAMNRPA